MMYIISLVSLLVSRYLLVLRYIDSIAHHYL